MAAGDLAATDIFSLGSGFHAQSSTTSNQRSITEVIAANGDIACQTPFGTSVTASAEYEVCGDAALSISLGATVGGYIVTSVEASQSAGESPRVTVEGIAFDGGETITNNTYAVSLTFDADDVSTNALINSGLDASAEATEFSYRWECNVVQTVGSDGQISFATSITPKLTYTESGIGTATGTPGAIGLVLESFENSDANQETDTYTATFVGSLVSV